MLLIEQIDELWERQLRDWKLVRDNYAALDKMLTRELWLHDSDGKPCSRVILQHNPARAKSTAANLSPEAIKTRPCFLCDTNQPAEQQAVLWASVDDLRHISKRERWYKIQVNPYPIFKRHLTISLVEHKPQMCYYKDMMELAQLLPNHVIMYNGPRFGASAPDHMHFQATTQDELPLCRELEARNSGGVDSCYGSSNELWMDNLSMRQLVYIRTQIFNSAIVADMSLALKQAKSNALCWFNEGMWHMVFFPRNLGRPACYGEGEGQLLVSPAAAEYGGVWVTPRRCDFESIDEQTVISIYKELSICDKQMKFLYDDYVRVN